MAWIRRAVSLMALSLLGIALLGLAWPRFLGGISRLESTSVYSKLQQEQTVSVEDIETALSDLNQAIQLIPRSANLYAERADLRIRLGRKLYLDGDPEALRILFLEARQDAADGLLRGPSDPYAWFILAHSEQIVIIFSVFLIVVIYANTPECMAIITTIRNTENIITIDGIKLIWIR